ncbi:hypothetical protein LSCM1_02249 [Leishmania martiniquensis]|uniref:Uncharacterized protein n=1 Tax=Leishmania martiniquensis TaxID=1580590 RepID=A0A836G5A3_9TRYP|nr:hypothetical protein LSCM1_02249 [Leishmania martiniquensis]
MQQVFREATSGGREGKPFIHFPLPTRAEERKRSRSPGETTTAERSNAANSLGTSLTPRERSALCRFIEYGSQPTPPSSWFYHNAEQRSTAAQLFAHRLEPSCFAGAPEHRWCFVALRQAMSLLCEVIRQDSAEVFLRTPSPLDAVAGETAASAEASTAPARVTTLELYCRFQALELELEDATLRTEAVAQRDGVPESVRLQRQCDVDETVKCIERSLNALEGTLVQMLLGNLVDVTVMDASRVDMSAAPPLEYVARMLLEVPSVLQSVRWPAQFLCDSTASSKGDCAGTKNTEAVESSSTSSLEQALLRFGSTARTDTAMSPLLEQFGGAATSLALRSLLDLCQRDVWNLLGVAAASPISRLAALEKLAAAASSDSTRAGRPSRPALDVENFAFKDILVRAWNGDYGRLGLRRLFFEVQVLFYKCAMHVQAKSKQAGGGNGATLGDVHRLWTTWHLTLQKHTAAFLAKLGTTELSAGEVLGVSSLADSCEVMRQHAVPASERAEVQVVALRVIAKLQAVDTKGWFAVPAFDMVNIDFTSVRYWISSPIFGRKSKREAYRSLCRALEHMVDRCVQKYGPAHAFSDVITNVRQKLVDVSRTEGLL